MYEKYLELLAKNNETTYQVAKATGIPQSAFSQWKHGRKLGVDKLVKIARHFNVSLDSLVGEII